MSINLSKNIETKQSIETQDIWIESHYVIHNIEYVGNDLYRIEVIKDGAIRLSIDNEVENMQMFIENYGWIDVLTKFDETNLLFIKNTVTKFRKLVNFPKIEKTIEELDKDIDATKLRDMFLERILPDIKKAIDKKETYIYIEGYCSHDMKNYLKNKGLSTDYIHGTGKTKIYF